MKNKILIAILMFVILLSFSTIMAIASEESSATNYFSKATVNVSVAPPITNLSSSYLIDGKTATTNRPTLGENNTPLTDDYIITLTMKQAVKLKKINIVEKFWTGPDWAASQITKIKTIEVGSDSGEFTIVKSDYSLTGCTGNGQIAINEITLDKETVGSVVKITFDHTAPSVYQFAEIEGYGFPVCTTVYNMDFDSFAQDDSVDGIEKTAGSQSVVVESTGNHYYRMSGAGTANILMWYYHNEFAPDTIVQADYRISGLTKDVTILLRDVNANGERLYLDTNGYLYLIRNSTKIYINQSVNCKDNWVNIALAFHFIERTYDVYINGVCVKSGISFESSSFCSDMYHIRYILNGAESTTATMDIDNIFVYKAYTYQSSSKLEGVGGELLQEEKKWEHEIDASEISPDMSIFTNITDTPLNNPTSRLTDYIEAKQAYDGAVCFAEGTNNIWIKNAKYSSEYKTMWEDEKILVAAPVLAALKNSTFIKNTDSVQIGNVTATVGDRCIFVDGKQVDTETKIQLINGEIYIPLEEFAIYGMKKWFGSSFLGFSVIANEPRSIHYEIDSCRPNLYTVSNTTQMMAYLLLERPNAKKISEIFNSMGTRQRPYCVTSSSEINSLQSLLSSDKNVKEYSDLVMLKAVSILNTNYTIKDNEGEQVSPVFGWNEPWTLYWAYINSGNKAYVEKAEEIALQMANLSHWSGEFHILQTAQAMLGTAYFYDLFYNEFSDTTKDALAQAIITKGFMIAKSYYEGSTEGIQYDWCTRCTNWNCVPNSAILVAAATLLGEGYDDNLCLEMMERAFVSLGYFMQYYAPDGGAGEGVGYTSFTLAYICPAIDVLNRVFGRDFGISNYPGLLEAGRFLAQTTSFKYSYTLNDDSAEGKTNLSTAYWFAEKNDDKALAKEILEYFNENPELKSTYASTVLPYMFSIDENTQEELPLDSVYNGAELAFSRDSRRGKGTFLGIHGGHNHVAHGRYDYGTFVFDAFGIRFATETGADNYSLSGIGNFTKNSGYYTIRAEGHNVYVVNPDESPGQNRYTYGRINVQENKEKGVIYTLDMLPAYSNYVSSAKRGYMLTNDRKVFVLQDEIVPCNSGDEFYWFWHTYADIEIDDENDTVILTRENKTLKLYFDATVNISLSQNAVEPLSTSPDISGQLQLDAHKSMKKIIAKFESDGTPITFRVIVEPIGQEYERGELIPISEWTIPEGSYDDAYYSKAAYIKVNGEEIENFSPDVYDYTIQYSSENEEPPRITAGSIDGKVTVKQADFSGDTAVIKVESGSTPDNYKIYTITLISEGPAQIISNRFADVDFEDYDKLTATPINEKFYVYYSKSGTASISEVSEGNKALSYTMYAANESEGVLDNTACAHIDYDVSNPTEINWEQEIVEFSFKTDSYARFRTVHFNIISFEADRNGNLYGIYNNEGKRHIGTYEPGKWYDVKIVYDRSNLYNNTYPRVFIYINGDEYLQEIGTNTSELWQATLLNKQTLYSEGNLRFTLFANEDSRVKLLLDNVKFYTIQKDNGQEYYNMKWSLKKGDSKEIIDNTAMLKPGDDVYVHTIFDNRTSWDKVNKLFFAIYEDGLLVDVIVDEFCADAYDVTRYTTTKFLEIPQNINSTTIKAFIWENKKLNPVVNNYEVSCDYAP